MLAKPLRKYLILLAGFYLLGWGLAHAGQSWFVFEAYRLMLMFVAAVFVLGHVFTERLSRALPESRFFIQLGNQVLRMVLLIGGLGALFVLGGANRPLHHAAWFMFFYVVFAIVDIQAILNTLRPDLKR